MNEKTNLLFLFRFVLLDKRKIDTSIDQSSKKGQRGNKVVYGNNHVRSNLPGKDRERKYLKYRNHPRHLSTGRYQIRTTVIRRR